MTWILAIAEAALLIRLFWTIEFVRRPCFTIFLIVSIYSATHYSLDRAAWLNQAVVSDAAKALVVLEAIWWMCQSEHFIAVLAFSIGFGAFPAMMAMGLPVKDYGSGLMWNTAALTYIASAFTFAVLYVSGNKCVRKQGGRVRGFDWILLVYLWVLPAASWRMYFIPGGKANSEWRVWNLASMEVLLACFLLWLVTERFHDYFQHEATADYKEEYRRLSENEPDSRHRLARQAQSS